MQKTIEKGIRGKAKQKRQEHRENRRREEEKIPSLSFLSHPKLAFGFSSFEGTRPPCTRVPGSPHCPPLSGAAPTFCPLSPSPQCMPSLFLAQIIAASLLSSLVRIQLTLHFAARIIIPKQKINPSIIFQKGLVIFRVRLKFLSRAQSRPGLPLHLRAIHSPAHVPWAGYTSCFTVQAQS